MSENYIIQLHHPTLVRRSKAPTKPGSSWRGRESNLGMCTRGGGGGKTRNSRGQPLFALVSAFLPEETDGGSHGNHPERKRMKPSGGRRDCWPTISQAPRRRADGRDGGDVSWRSRSLQRDRALGRPFTSPPPTHTRPRPLPPTHPEAAPTHFSAQRGHLHDAPFQHFAVTRPLWFFKSAEQVANLGGGGGGQKRGRTRHEAESRQGKSICSQRRSVSIFGFSPPRPPLSPQLGSEWSTSTFTRRLSGSTELSSEWVLGHHQHKLRLGVAALMTADMQHLMKPFTGTLQQTSLRGFEFITKA